MRFAIRNFGPFGDWVEYDDSKITVLAGPNGSGKSSIAEALSLLSSQDDIWRLSFTGQGRPYSSFAQAVTDHDTSRSIDLRISIRVDAFAAMLPLGRDGYESVDYPLEFHLSYTSDPFDGGMSGILTDMSIHFGQAGKESLLFSVQRVGGEYSLFIDLKEVLHLPFVFARIPSPELPSIALRDAKADFQRVLASLARLRSIAPGNRKAALGDLTKLVHSQQKELAMGQAFVRLVQGREKEEAEVQSFLLRVAEHRKSFLAEEPKYLKAIADLFVREALMANDIDSLASPSSLILARPSFESLFHECLAAARVRRPGSPWRAFAFTREAGRGEAPAASARRLVDLERGKYGARLRDMVNEAAFRREDGRTGIEEIHFRESYREILASFKASALAKEGFRLVPDGQLFDPLCLDLEQRWEELGSILKGLGIAEALELPLPGQESWPFALAKGGLTEALASHGEGISFLVLLSVWATHSPWGSCMVLEYPEAGLHPPLQEALAGLLAGLKEKYATSFIVETHSERLLQGLARLTAEGRLEPGEVAILAFGNEAGRRSVRRYSLDRKGRPSPPAIEPFLEAALGGN